MNHPPSAPVDPPRSSPATPLDGDIVVATLFWCVSYRDGEVLAIGTRDECIEYMRVEKARCVRRLLPLSDVDSVHPLAHALASIERPST